MKKGLLLAVVALTSACVNGQPLAPTPAILPDAVVLGAGEAQVFNVVYASVRSVTLTGDGENWQGCVALDSAYPASSGIRVVVTGPCHGHAYVTVDIGAQRSPLVALVAFR
jgi:hypothetical protein